MPTTTACPQCQQPLDQLSRQQPHQRPDGTRCVFVIVYATHYLESQVHEGDHPYDDVRETITDCLPDEFDVADGLDATDLAVKEITGKGLYSPSSSSWHPHLWYSNPDGSYTVNYRTGEEVEESAHLYGFTDNEELLIHTKVALDRVRT